MKNILFNKKTAIIFLVITIIFIGFYAYMLARPISYGMSYHNKTEYDGGVFEGTMKFYSDNTMLNRNTNINQQIESRYYYKNGNVFFTLAETDEDYADEVAFINENFDEAVKMPFYADEINAFRMVATEGDGFETVYNCTSAVIFAIVGGVVILALAAFTAVAFILCKRKVDYVEAC